VADKTVTPTGKRMAGFLCLAGLMLCPLLLCASVTISFTGEVESDFTGAYVTTAIDAGGIGDVGVPLQAPAGTIVGWDMADARFAWDYTTDTMYIGINMPTNPNAIAAYGVFTTSLQVEAVTAGAGGNVLNLTITDSGGGGPTVSVTGGTDILVNIDIANSTTQHVADAINNDGPASAIVSAEGSAGSAAILTQTNLSGGFDAGSAGDVVAGDPGGSGDPDATADWLTLAGGSDLANWSDTEFVAVMFDMNQDGTFDAVAGVSADGTQPTKDDISDFGIYTFSGDDYNPGFAFGAPLAGQTATLFDYTNTPAPDHPTSSEPDLEFTISNFMDIPFSGGADPRPQSYYVRIVMGSQADAGIGEDTLGTTLVNVIPEPGCAMLFVLGAAAFGLAGQRRRLRHG